MAGLLAASAVFNLTACLGGVDDGSNWGCVTSRRRCTGQWPPAQWHQCRMAAAYGMKNKNIVRMKLAAKLDGQNGYIAIGFSQDPLMGKDAVTECVKMGDVVTAYTSYDIGNKTNRRNDQRITEANIKLSESSTSDGVLYCEVEQKVEPANHEDKVWPLDTPYYMGLT